jgi:stress response protein YsnF
MQDKTLPPGDTVIGLAEETASITKRLVVDGQVRVTIETGAESATLRDNLRQHCVEVERVPVGRLLEVGEEPPATRQEDDTLVIPVLEETAVLVKCLVLREEVRLRFASTVKPFEQQVVLRRETARIERDPSPHTHHDPERVEPT